MKSMLKELFTSKKTWMAIAAIVAFAVGKIGWDVDAETLLIYVTPLLLLMGVQGVADVGKSKAKILAKSQDKLIEAVAAKDKADSNPSPS